MNGDDRLIDVHFNVFYAQYVHLSDKVARNLRRNLLRADVCGSCVSGSLSQSPLVGGFPQILLLFSFSENYWKHIRTTYPDDLSGRPEFIH